MRVSRGTTPSRGSTRWTGSVGDLPSPSDGKSPSWRRRGLGLVRALIVVGLTAAGCTPDPGPMPSTSPSAVVSPTVTPTPTSTPTPDASVKPERPAAMDEVSAAGAEAVAVYFLQLFPYVFATGDLDDYRALSHPECIYCANAAAAVEEMLAAGQHSVGGLGFASEVISSEIDPGRWWLVTLTPVSYTHLRAHET